MNRFPVSPEDCLILKAIKDSQSLREAAQLLECDPAGLTRRVQAISSEHGLLQKVNNRWQLTAAALNLVAWAEDSIQSQRNVLALGRTVRIASTMWFGEEVLIPRAAEFREAMGKDADLAFSVPTQSFESAVLDGSVDFVIVCHPPETPEIEHRRIAAEEWAVIMPPVWARKGVRSLDELRARPFIRHQSMNTDLFLPGLGEIVSSGIEIDNLIGIRSAVSHGLGWSIVPRLSAANAMKEGRIAELPYELSIKDRHICVWWLRSRPNVRRQSAKICAWVKEIVDPG